MRLELRSLLVHHEAMTEFLFFRHGETDWNKAQFFQGHTDIPLNATGIAQAQSLGEKVQDWNPDFILSSDLTRAKQTAEGCLNFWKTPIQFSDQLREMHLGKAEGLHRDEVMKLIGQDWVRWVSPKANDEHFGFPGGETKAETRARVLKFLEGFIQQNPNYKRIAVSTHGGVLKRVTHGLPGIPKDGVPIPNCVTYRLNFDEGKWSYIPVRERASTVVIHEEKILAFKAQDPTNKALYHFIPGGVLEPSEDPILCTKRETHEETGYPVQVIPASKITFEYDFTWDGQARWCRTDFFKAQLEGPYYDPRPIKDANYHLGVIWIKKSELQTVFSYSSPIHKAVSRLMD